MVLATPDTRDRSKVPVAFPSESKARLLLEVNTSRPPPLLIFGQVRLVDPGELAPGPELGDCGRRLIVALADSGDLLAGGIEPAVLGGVPAGIGLGLGVAGTSKGYGDGSVFVVAQSAKIRGNPVGLVGKVIVDFLGVVDQVIGSGDCPLTLIGSRGARIARKGQVTCRSGSCSRGG